MKGKLCIEMSGSVYHIEDIVSVEYGDKIYGGVNDSFVTYINIKSITGKIVDLNNSTIIID